MDSSSSRSRAAGPAPAVTLFRGAILHTTGDALTRPEEEVFEAFPDGGLAVDAAGRVLACGSFARLDAEWPDARRVAFPDCVLLPALVDCHIHYPQAGIVAAFGEQLLDWLDRHVMPEEARYADVEYARLQARVFFDELIAQGTGTALIFGPHFEEATAVAFEEADRRRFRALLGMSLGDRNLPPALLRSPEESTDACRRLIERFHRVGTARYAVTPRFAPACSDRLLAACRRLMEEVPDVYLQTHINENRREIAWCRELFPAARDYLDIYEHAGLLGPRTVMAHDVHPLPRELEAMAVSGTRVAHCPQSNGFLGSGLFPLRAHVEHGIAVGLGTDVGAGTSVSMFSQMNAAYQVQALRMFSGAAYEPAGGMMLSGVRLLYLATLAGARVLGLDEECGSFLAGRQADFIVLDPTRDPFIAARLANCASPAEQLFVLAMTADKRLIREVYLGGRPALEPAGLSTV